MNKALIAVALATTGLMQAVSYNQFKFHAASVLPVTHFTKNGKQVKYAILSREAGGADKGTYDDFGGKRDHNEWNSEVTAAREFFEEGICSKTLGMNLNSVRSYIQSNNTETVLTNTSAVTYITHFPHTKIIGFRKAFHPARVQAKAWGWQFQEKDRIATVRWDALRNAILNSHSNTGVTVKACLIDPKNGRETGKQTITLRPYLVKRLRPHFNNPKANKPAAHNPAKATMNTQKAFQHVMHKQMNGKKPVAKHVAVIAAKKYFAKAVAKSHGVMPKKGGMKVVAKTHGARKTKAHGAKKSATFAKPVAKFHGKKAMKSVAKKKGCKNGKCS